MSLNLTSSIIKVILYLSEYRNRVLLSLREKGRTPCVKVRLVVIQWCENYLKYARDTREQIILENNGRTV